MTDSALARGIILFVMTTSADPSVGNPQRDAPVGNNQNKLALPEMSGQITLLKW